MEPNFESELEPEQNVPSDGPGFQKFGVIGYTIFAAVFLISTGIGLFHGCWASRGKAKTAEGFNMGNRQMSTLPVALSLLCSVVSAITMLGDPVEIYLYGVQYSLVALAFVNLTITLLFLYVPVFFSLQISSAYEYLEMRFGPRTRTFTSCICSLSLMAYMSIVVYGPSLALVEVTGMTSRVSCGIIFIVCIFYSTIGGFKTVVWTDAFQALVMLGAMVAIVINGFINAGGPGVVWKRLSDTGRNNFFNFDLDPRTRHTVWTSIIGRYFLWLYIYATNQSQIQRFNSLPTFAHVRRALLINMVGLMITSVLTTMAGIVTYAHYYQCDPITTKTVRSNDQLLPLFIMETGGPILTGLYVAGITCASLSTVSSGLSALASVFTYDLVRKIRPLWNEQRLFYCSQFACILFGMISYLFVFIAENLGNILPAAGGVTSLASGPTLGLFTLGMFFPFTNAKGSILGMLLAITLMATLIFGTFIANANKSLPDQRLPLSTMGCQVRGNYSGLYLSGERWKETAEVNNGFLDNIWSISFMWQPTLTTNLTILFGIVFSVMVNIYETFKANTAEAKKKLKETRRINYKLMSPPILKFWKTFLPGQLAKWVDLGSEDCKNEVFNLQEIKNCKSKQ